jgi:AcrR family transcriptional regulator
MTSAAGRAPSARQDELLELAYRYVLTRGLADMSLRPLAKAIGSSPRVLLFLYGSKDNLIRALLERARADELAAVAAFGETDSPADLIDSARQVWGWLSAESHRHLLGLWVEAYARSLVDPDGPWAGFAAQTVQDWLGLLASRQPPRRRGRAGAAERTAVLAVLRGAMLDLLATGDVTRTGRAVDLVLQALRPSR